MQAMLARLFPFGRGLSHAYWAPNFWALLQLRRQVRAVRGETRRPRGILPGARRVHGWGNGRSRRDGRADARGASHRHPGDRAFTALVSAAPAVVEHSRTLWPRDRSTSLAQLRRGWQLQRHVHLLRLTAHVTLCAFMFGWHVHEKASLMVTVPSALALALDNSNLAGRKADDGSSSTRASTSSSPPWRTTRCPRCSFSPGSGRSRRWCRSSASS